MTRASADCHAAAGLLHKGGVEEDVAVKVLSLQNAATEHVDVARRELRLMCTVSQQLAGYVIELKGYLEDPGRELVLAMELADSSLRDWLQNLENHWLPLHMWVRSCTITTGT
jgi:hypothetical protein